MTVVEAIAAFTVAAGLLTLTPGLDTALILRTALYAAGAAWLQAGAGIVRASVPEKEYQETLAKMGAVAEALGVDLQEVCR